MMPNRLPTNMPALRKVATPVMALCLGFGLASGPSAVAANPLAPLFPVPQAATSSDMMQVGDETISLYIGLIRIERDLLLGQLFLQDGLVSAKGSYFTHPRMNSLPAIKDGLAAAGAPDLEPLLIALEEATDKESLAKAYTGVHSGLLKSRAALKPTDQDMIAAVILSAEHAASLLDPSGTTDVLAYQESWGLMMAARGQLDLLDSSADPAIKKLAAEMALAFDDVILFAPDPNAKAPVAFDRALIIQLIEAVKGKVGSA